MKHSYYFITSFTMYTIITHIYSPFINIRAVRQTPFKHFIGEGLKHRSNMSLPYLPLGQVVICYASYITIPTIVHPENITKIVHKLLPPLAGVRKDLHSAHTIVQISQTRPPEIQQLRISDTDEIPSQILSYRLNIQAARL